jgi:hypothetical protein
METNLTPNGHNLEQLFGRLTVKTRHELDDLWDTDIRRPEKQAVLDRIRQMLNGENLRLDLRYALKYGADGFSELRYFYEKEQSFFLLADFPFVLRRAILRRCRHWGSLLPKPSKSVIRGPVKP